MRKKLLLLLLTAFSSAAWSQAILVVDDNNYFPSNTDTIITDLNGTTYTQIDEWDIVDEGALPDATLFENYDLVIWYCSSDGSDLNLWDEGTNGLFALNVYLYGMGKVWIIGTDMLYSGGYTAPTTFTSGSFAYDKMGLLSYDAQSYADDAGAGVSELNVVSGAPANFSNPISWIFPTSWYVDAVTPNSETVSIYEMGPASYTFAGKSVMTRNTGVISNVTSSFFDPFEIDTYANRVEFFQSTIDYILYGGLGIDETKVETLSVYPNPVDDVLTIQLNQENTSADYEVVSSAGKVILSGNGTIADVSNLAAGIYLLKTNNATARFVKK